MTSGKHCVSWGLGVLVPIKSEEAKTRDTLYSHTNANLRSLHVRRPTPSTSVCPTEVKPSLVVLTEAVTVAKRKEPALVELGVGTACVLADGKWAQSNYGDTEPS